MTLFDPAADGWRLLTGAAMPGGLGAPWAKRVGEAWHYGLLTTAEHANPNGVVHGGVLMAFADHGLSMMAWEASGRAPCTTIQLNTHFLAAVQPGDFLELTGDITRATRGLVFVRGLIAVGGRDAVAIDAIWRVLKAR